MRIRKGSIKRANEGLTMLVRTISGKNIAEKPLRDCGARFVEKLIELTKKNKLVWKKIFDYYQVEYKNWVFVFNWKQDDRPKLVIAKNQATNIIRGYEYKLDILEKTINAQETTRRKQYTDNNNTQEQNDRQKLIARSVLFVGFLADTKNI